MAETRTALIVLLGSTLFVVSCAAWLERPVAPRTEAVVEPAPASEPAAATAAPSAPEPRLMIPVKGVTREALRDNFDDRRGSRTHKAIDIMARRGTPVVAAGDGRIAKMYHHRLGGLCVYQYAADGKHVYYYAHLDSFASGLGAGSEVKRGDVIGYVGTTGNASPTAPHLHFALFRLGADGKWYKGTPVNPYPYLVEPAR